MTRPAHTCTSAGSVDALMAAMTDHRIRHVPVVEDGRLVGVAGVRDVVKSRIDQLDTYLHQGNG